MAEPGIIRGRVELNVPHKEGIVQFAYPSAGSRNYRAVGDEILKRNQRLPEGSETA